MYLQNITGLNKLDLKNETINQDGVIVGKPNALYLIGRAILWFLTCGKFKINPALNEGTKKVIDASHKILKDLEVAKDAGDVGSACDQFKDSLLNVQKLQNGIGGQKSAKKELGDLIKKIDDIKAKTIPSKTNQPGTVEDVKNKVIDRLSQETTREFVQNVMNGTIATREEFLQQAAIFYPEIVMYEDVKEGSAEKIADERKRTETSLLFVYWLWKSDEKAATEKEDQAYQDFIVGQFGTKLTWESFKELRATFKAKYKTLEELDFFLVTMTLHDLGKVDHIQKKANNDKSVEVELHDEILLKIFKTMPQILPSFSSLSEARRNELIYAWGLDYLGPQFMQAERPPAGLTNAFKGMSEKPAVTEHFFLHDLCDLAGTLGYAAPDKDGKYPGCKTLNEETYQAWKKSCELIKSSKDEKEAYTNYLAYRAEILKLSEEAEMKKEEEKAVEEKKAFNPKAKKFNLDVSKPEDYAFTRLCCMLRLFNQGTAQNIKAAFDKLKDEQRAEFDNLVAELNRSGFEDDKKAILVYYAPALMLNMNGYSFPAPATKVDALLEGLKMLNKTFVVTREYLDGKADEPKKGVFTVNATEVASTFASPKPGITTRWMLVDYHNMIKFNADNKHAVLGGIKEKDDPVGLFI